MGTTADTDEILGLIAQEGLIDRAKLAPETRLDELAIPSLDMLNILFALESKYDVTIDADDMKHAATLGDLIDLVRAKVPSADGGTS
jgi:acyl carrier protein